jgi:hypothetical protein
MKELTFTKIRISTPVARGMSYVAFRRGFPRQMLFEALAAKFVLEMAPEIKDWDGLALSASLPVSDFAVKDLNPSIRKSQDHMSEEEFTEKAPQPVILGAESRKILATYNRVMVKDYDAHYADVIRENQHRDLGDDEIKRMAMERMRDE